MFISQSVKDINQKRIVSMIRICNIWTDQAAEEEARMQNKRCVPTVEGILGAGSL